MPLLLLLKQAWERRELILLALLLGLMAITRQQRATILALRARPTVEFRDRVVEKRVVVRGPVRIVKEVVKAVDGTLTTRTITDRAAETINTDKDREKTRVETPPTLPPDSARTRYVGLALDPFDRGMPKRARAGLTFWNCLDAGVAWEPRRAPTDGAVQAEIGWRF